MRLRAAVTAGFAALAVAAPAQADTFTVTNGASDSSAGLTPARPARACARRSPPRRSRGPADTINVPAGTININNDMLVGSDMTIAGTSARTNIIDGGAKYRGLRVAAGATVSFSHFTIRNGAAGQGGSNDGGGVLNAGALTLDYVRVTGSRAATRGGGVANVRGTCSLTACARRRQTSRHRRRHRQRRPVETARSRTSCDERLDGVRQHLRGRRGGGVASINNGGLLDGAGDHRRQRRRRARHAAASRGSPTARCRSVSQHRRAQQGRRRRRQLRRTLADQRRLQRRGNDTCGFDSRRDAGARNEARQRRRRARRAVDRRASPAIDRSRSTAQLPPARSTSAACTGRRAPRATRAPTSSTWPPRSRSRAGRAARSARRQRPVRLQLERPGADPVCQLTGPGQPGGYVTCYKSNAQPYSGLANGTFTFSVRDSAFPPPAGHAHVHGRGDGQHDHRRPVRADERHDADVHVLGRQRRRELPVPGRHRHVRALHLAVHHRRARPGRAHLRGPRAQRRRRPGGTPASRAFTVDTAAPDTTITGGPTGTVASTTATFTYTSTEAGSTFQCALDGAAFGACPASYTGLAQGAHTFQVRATDPAGNTDGTPASRAWTVDTVAPDTTIPAGRAAASVDQRHVHVHLDRVRLDVPVRARRRRLRRLPGRLHRARPGRAHLPGPRDRRVGNTDASPASRTWTVDTVVPDTTITAGPSGTVASTSATFTYTSTEAGSTFQCQIDGGGFGACPASYTGLGQGSHTFSVRAVDAAGNIDATPGRPHLDRRHGRAEHHAHARHEPRRPHADLHLHLRAGATFQCRVDGAAFATCTSPLTTASLGDGAHTFDVRAIDAAGNVDATPRRRRSRSTPPRPTRRSTRATADQRHHADLHVHLNEAGATFQCRVDGAAFAACTSPFTTAALARARTRSRSRGRPAGNLDRRRRRGRSPSTPRRRRAGSSPARRADHERLARVRVRGLRDGRVPARRAGAAVGAFGACTSPKSFNALTPGDYVFFVRSTDAAGNTETRARSRSPRRRPAADADAHADATPPPPTPAAQTASRARGGHGPREAQGHGRSSRSTSRDPERRGGRRAQGPRDGSLDPERRRAARPPSSTTACSRSTRRRITDLQLTEKLTGCPKAKKSSSSAAEEAQDPQAVGQRQGRVQDHGASTGRRPCAAPTGSSRTPAHDADAGDPGRRRGQRLRQGRRSWSRRASATSPAEGEASS